MVAGLVAFEAVLALGTGAVGIPGVLLVRLAGGSGGAGATATSEAPEGGESVFAKLSSAPAISTSKPTPADEAAEAVSPAAGEPRLDGLAEIPLKEWDRDEAESAEPQAFGENSKTREVLPWDAVEPVPFTAATPVAAPAQSPAPEAPQATPAPALLPASGDVEAWVKAKATEIKGGDRARPLYHFEFWLEPPEEVKRRLVAVAYEFNTPAVMPQSQMSSEQQTGFRVSAGGLACADKVTVTLKFKDGQSQQVAVDGCRLVS
ncbi:MAG: hypothetical protein A2W02_00075 [Alphaproteobacteria bacterium RBG_16_64_48]|nr:MAG: hypothetical protein A2W02_00075 [Alphaproteobacteria bacterium RBG_16_64_48]